MCGLVIVIVRCLYLCRRMLYCVGSDVFVRVILVFMWAILVSCGACNNVGDPCICACVYINFYRGTLVYSYGVSASGLFPCLWA